MTLERSFSPTARGEEAVTPLLSLEFYRQTTRIWIPATGIVDSGSSVTVIHEGLAMQLGLDREPHQTAAIRLADGTELEGWSPASPVPARVVGAGVGTHNRDDYG